MTKRYDVLQSLKNNKVQDSVSKLMPSMPAGDLDYREEALLDADVNLSRLKDSLSKANKTLVDYLADNLGFVITKPQREIRTPSGETYIIAHSHLIFKELSNKCVIDEDNIRDRSECTEETLSDIIDEIGSGLQNRPVFAYVGDNGKLSIIDGSRRFACAMIRKVGLDVEIFDRKPSSKTINWIIEASDKKKRFSLYDKGKMFFRMMQINSWKQADLVDVKKYSKQEVSRCVTFYKTPYKIINFFIVKDLTKHQVDQFNSAVNFITKIDAINEVVDCLKANCVGYGSLTKIEQNKVIINTVVGYAKSIKRNKVSGSNESKLRYLFNNGEIKVSLYRPNRDNTQVRLHKVPKDEEKEIISLISEVLRKYEQIESPPGGTL